MDGVVGRLRSPAPAPIAHHQLQGTCKSRAAGQGPLTQSDCPVHHTRVAQPPITQGRQAMAATEEEEEEQQHTIGHELRQGGVSSQVAPRLGRQLRNVLNAHLPGFENAASCEQGGDPLSVRHVLVKQQPESTPAASQTTAHRFALAAIARDQLGEAGSEVPAQTAQRADQQAVAR